MIFSNSIFMGILFPNWFKILWKIKERLNYSRLLRICVSINI
nr:MAG TPA: hypothetical protein [Caudoviricetes sp.]